MQKETTKPTVSPNNHEDVKPENVESAQLPVWLKQWVGAFKDDPDFDAAMERGAEYRRLQPTVAEEWDAIEIEKERRKMRHNGA